MKRLLLTLTVLCMAVSAFAECVMYIEDFELKRSELGTEIVVPIKAHFSAKVSAWEVELSYPDGLTASYVDCGSDMAIDYYNKNGESRTQFSALYGAYEPYDHFIATCSEYGYWQDPNGEDPNAWVCYGIVKWEGGDYDEMLLLHLMPSINFDGGDINITFYAGSGNDTRGGTIGDNGDQGKYFYSVCHITVKDDEEENALTVCDDHYTNGYVPVYGIYYDEAGAKSQMIYPAEMLTAMKGGKITQLKFYAEGQISFSGGSLELSLKKVDEIGFTEFVTITGAHPVASTVPSSGLTELVFDLDEPFEYTDGNLLVETLVLAPGAYGRTYFRGAKTDYNSSLYRYGNYSGSLVKFLPKATFTYTGGAGSGQELEQTVAPVFSGYDSENGYVVSITPSEDSNIYYRIIKNHNEYGEWTAYTGELLFNEQGYYCIEAYAKAEGKTASDVMAYEFIVQALPQTESPVISYSLTDEAVIVTAEGNGEVLLYANGEHVENPCTIPRTNADQQFTFSATAQEEGKLISETTVMQILIPAKENNPNGKEFKIEKVWELNDLSFLNKNDARQGFGMGGKFYINDKGTKTVYVVDQDGLTGTTYPGGANCGITRDDAGNIIVSNAAFPNAWDGNATIKVINPQTNKVKEYIVPTNCGLNGRCDFIGFAFGDMMDGVGELYLAGATTSGVASLITYDGNIVGHNYSIWYSLTPSSSTVINHYRDLDDNSCLLYVTRNSPPVKIGLGEKGDTSKDGSITLVDKGSINGVFPFVWGDKELFLYPTTPNYFDGFAIAEAGAEPIVKVLATATNNANGYQCDWLNAEVNDDGSVSIYQYYPGGHITMYRLTDNSIPVSEKTATPEITYEITAEAVVITATGEGNVILYVDGLMVDNPYSVIRTETDFHVTATATAQEEGKLISETTTLVIGVPAKPMEQCLTPSISFSETNIGVVTVTIDNLEEGASIYYWVYRDGELIKENSFIGNNYRFDVSGIGTYTISAVAKKEGMLDSYSSSVFFMIFEDPLPVMLGDVNGDGMVNIADLNEMLNIIFYDGDFVVEADMNKDGIINVQDVVGLVHYLLNGEIPSISSNGRRAPKAETVGQASLYWQDGVLYMNSDVPVSALNMINDVGGDITWNLDDYGMVVMQETGASGEHSVIFSFDRNVIPPGVSAIATTNSQTPSVVGAELSTLDSKLIPVTLNDQITGLTSIQADGEINCYMDGSNLVIDNNAELRDLDITAYTIDGRAVANQHLMLLDSGRTSIEMNDIIKSNRYLILVVRNGRQILATLKLTQNR